MLDTTCYILQGRGTRDFATYLQCSHEKAIGFNRQYFSHKDCFGKRLLNLCHLHVLEGSYGLNAKARFDNNIVTDGWIPLNDITQSYYNVNNQQITKNQSLRKDLSDLTFQEQATMQDLYFDFANRYEKADIDSVDKYFAVLKEEGAHELFYKSLMRRNEF